MHVRAGSCMMHCMGSCVVSWIMYCMCGVIHCMIRGAVHECVSVCVCQAMRALHILNTGTDESHA